tara:strand:+ start:733 stop:1254 length:522 start_codon:yes stop_codon:yes gene_type:complete
MEYWKTIKGFSGYEASTLGRLRSLNYKRTNKAKVLKPSISGGYLKTMIKADNGKYKSSYVHKFVCLAFLGDRPNKYEINHKDGVKTNNSTENLEYVTKSENIKHAYRLGLLSSKVGSSNGMAKLTESDVLEIREHAANNGRYYGRGMLAERYKVSQCTIKEVVSKRRGKFYNV